MSGFDGALQKVKLKLELTVGCQALDSWDTLRMELFRAVQEALLLKWVSSLQGILLSYSDLHVNPGLVTLRPFICVELTLSGLLLSPRIGKHLMMTVKTVEPGAVLLGALGVCQARLKRGGHWWVDGDDVDDANGLGAIDGGVVSWSLGDGITLQPGDQLPLIVRGLSGAERDTSILLHGDLGDAAWKLVKGSTGAVYEIRRGTFPRLLDG